MIDNSYVVVATGTSKKSGNPYSRLERVVSLDTVTFLDSKTPIYLDVIKNIGEVVKIKTTIL